MNPITLKVLQFLISAHSDYGAARTLLRAGFLFQGAHLAALCVEKLFKAVLGVPKESCKLHMEPKLFAMVASVAPGMARDMDAGFIKALEFAYSCRYLDNLSVGDGLTIAQSRFLAEFDRVVSKIDASLTLSSGMDTPLREAIKRKDKAIVADNVFVARRDLNEMLSQPTLVVDLWISPVGQSMCEVRLLAIPRTELPFDHSPALPMPVVAGPPAVGTPLGMALSHTPYRQETAAVV